MRKRVLMGAVAAIALAFGVAASAQRAGGPGQGQNPPAGPPPAMSPQGGQPQGQMGPGGPGRQGRMGDPAMGGGQMGPGMGQSMGQGMGPGMRGRGGMMGQAGGPGQPGGRGGRGGRAGGPGGQPPLERMLNLTPEQQASVARIRLDAADASATLMSQGRELREELHRAAFADTKEAAKLADLTTKILANQKQILEIETKTQTDIAAVLTAEQRKRMRVGR